MLEKDALADYRKAGAIIAEALEYGRSLVKVDASILDVCRSVERRIVDLGGFPAFPAQPSIDNVAAHWCPDPGSEETFAEGQLVKLDIGCHVNGRIADTALSIDLSDDARHEELIRAATDARDAALRLMTPGTTLGEIGATIQQTIGDAGFSPIRNLCGHGLDTFEVHVWPSIPNIDTGDATELEEGMIVAVEPFATAGKGQVHEQDVANIYSLKQRKPVRSMYGRKALQIAERYEGLPFALHWLADDLGMGAAKLGMRDLIQAGAADAYPPLTEVSGAIVSQAEHSVIVADKPLIYTRP